MFQKDSNFSDDDDDMVMMMMMMMARMYSIYHGYTFKYYFNHLF